MTGVWHQVTSIWFTGYDHFRREEGCGRVRGSVSPERTALARFSSQISWEAPESRCTPQVPGVQPRIPRDLQHLPQSHWRSRSNQESLTANMGSSVPGKQQRPALVERGKAPNHLISISIPIITLWTPFWVLFDFLLWSCAALIWTRTRPPLPPPWSVGSGWWPAAYLKWQKLLWVRELSASFLLLNKAFGHRNAHLPLVFYQSMKYTHLFQILMVTVSWSFAVTMKYLMCQKLSWLD